MFLQACHSCCTPVSVQCQTDIDGASHLCKVMFHSGSHGNMSPVAYFTYLLSLEGI